MLASIITPTLNSVIHIREALDSVDAQSGTCIEHIVVDGGSSDGTCALVAARPTLRLIRHPGSSVYEALNTGLAAARGEVIGFLNSDDAYLPGALATVYGELAGNPDLAILSGGAEIVRRYRNGADRVIARYLTKDDIAQIGRFDTRYKLAADREFLIRAARTDPPLGQRIVPQLVYRYRSHPGSLTLSGNRSRRLLIAAEHLVLSAEILSRASGDRVLVDVMRQWHSREAAVLACHRLTTGDWARLCQILTLGWRHDPRFVRSAIGTILSWAIRRPRSVVARS